MNAVTRRLKPIFSVHQYNDEAHTPWIEVGNATAEQGFPPDLFGFELKPGTTFQQAEEVARYLNNWVSDFCATS
jgi:uncharacterized SAM-binding protein YcdF (DUF218 family)